MSDNRIVHIASRGISVRGNDIDTDRIIPARFMKVVTFDGLGEYSFEDDRQQEKERGGVHPFDQPRFAGAGALLVNNNFGCGSSREHAPQALMRWGIRFCIGEGFAEIFRGNCVSLGIPCATTDSPTMQKLQTLAEERPDTVFELDVENSCLRAGDLVVQVAIPDGEKQRLASGNWDALGTLLGGQGAVEKTMAGLPYLKRFR